MLSTNRRRLVCLVIMLALIPLGLLCRFVPMGLPAVIVKYCGSFLWAAMVYWLIAFLLAQRSPMVLGLIAVFVCTAVEFFKNIHTPVLETFRGTFAGKVLLGRYFSYADIAVYWFAIGCSVWLDRTRARHTYAPRE